MLGPELTFVDDNHVLFQEKKLLYFGGTDYHRLSRHPAVRRAAAELLQQDGLSASGSRITTGNHPLYRELEQKLAGFFDTETAILLPSGYLSNLALLQGVADEYHLLLMDEASHPGLADAARWTGIPIIPFRHRDAGDLEMKIQAHLKARQSALVLTDGVFPVTGEMAPLADYVLIAQQYGARILIDDAHGMAVLGRTGKGSPEEAGIDVSPVFQTGTLSKGFGSFGGLVAGRTDLIRRIREKSAVFAGSTPPPLPMAAAAIQSLSILKSEPLIARLRETTLDFKKKLVAMGLDLSLTAVPIISISFGQQERNKLFYRMLLGQGIFPPLNTYPGSPPGGHFRFVLSSQHTEAEIELLIHTIQKMISKNEV